MSYLSHTSSIRTHVRTYVCVCGVWKWGVFIFWIEMVFVCILCERSIWSPIIHVLRAGCRFTVALLIFLFLHFYSFYNTKGPNDKYKTHTHTRVLLKCQVKFTLWLKTRAVHNHFASHFSPKPTTQAHKHSLSPSICESFRNVAFAGCRFRDARLFRSFEKRKLKVSNQITALLFHFFFRHQRW